MMKPQSCRDAGFVFGEATLGVNELHKEPTSCPANNSHVCLSDVGIRRQCSHSFSQGPHGWL